MKRYHPYLSPKQKAKLITGTVLSIVGFIVFVLDTFGIPLFHLQSENAELFLTAAFFALFWVGILVINLPENKQDVQQQIESGLRAGKAQKMIHVSGLTAETGCSCTAAVYKKHLSIFAKGTEYRFPLQQIESAVCFTKTDYQNNSAEIPEPIKKEMMKNGAEQMMKENNLLFVLHDQDKTKTILLTGSKNTYLFHKLLLEYKNELTEQKA